jgi:hypothetical protein
VDLFAGHQLEDEIAAGDCEQSATISKLQRELAAAKKRAELSEASARRAYEFVSGSLMR